MPCLRLVLACQPGEPDRRGWGARGDGGEGCQAPHQGPGGCPPESQAGHGPADQRIPGADERQTGPGHWDRHLQEAAGGRGGQVRYNHENSTRQLESTVLYSNENTVYYQKLTFSICLLFTTRIATGIQSINISKQSCKYMPSSHHLADTFIKIRPSVFHLLFCGAFKNIHDIHVKPTCIHKLSLSVSPYSKLQLLPYGEC